MTEPPKTLAEFEDLLAKAKAAGLLPDHAVGQREERHGACVPAPEPDGCLRPGRADQRLDLPEAGRDDRYARRTSRPRSTWSSGSRTATSRPTSTPSSTLTLAARFGKGEGVFTFNGDWQNAGYDTDLPGNVGFFLMPPARGWRIARRHVRPADFWHRRQCQERGLRRVLPQLGRHQRQGTAD